MVHSSCVDTAVVFPHRRGLPFHRALRDLVILRPPVTSKSDEGIEDTHGPPVTSKTDEGIEDTHGSPVTSKTDEGIEDTHGPPVTSSCELHNCLKTYLVKPSDLLELCFIQDPVPVLPHLTGPTRPLRSSPLNPLLAIPSTPLSSQSPNHPYLPFPAEPSPPSQEVPCMPSSESPGHFGQPHIYYGVPTVSPGNGFIQGPVLVISHLTGPIRPMPPSPMTPLLGVPRTPLPPVL
ncbi:36.4 kDa proline-rich protein-like [Homalodisca vitripennis]|uniref:36.4 kDa proline-rich protein-like n=1 Tax=Homalodisca vitripennis TaxID=197043 RepID=UPI001EEB5DA4|nr:36.4 kDa proline-rich protein-like [Homalodisca vitripennis]